ncbi:MAG: hypothetical protein H6568_04900 [Lewinellaceae bacterium]|nr:hypothetical protein [Saprospiraceae bacterium]MCB9312083.1 hypothetical protein [Lewinellaceae bacterium]HRW75696.1 hypothetical protein [Saprospiraceae bacterium]
MKPQFTALFGLAILLLPVHLVAQAGVCPYSRVNESILVESYWQYRYTLHTGTNQVIHQGGAQFPSYLHFRYDNSAEISTNGQYSQSSWSVNQGRLMLHYRQDSIYCVQRPDPNTLQLGFQAPNSRTDYLYVFSRIDAGQSPFQRPWYELPTILVRKDQPTRTTGQDTPWWAFWRRWQRPATPPGPPPIPIRIEVSGGGYYGGINPVYRQYVTINSEGRLIREVQTKRDGLMVTRKNISRSELEDFAEWIQENGYFELDREYDCTDQECHRRKRERPRPMPLQTSITIGQRTKIVTVPIWGEDNRHVRYIDHPPLIDQIVETVYRMADRQEIRAKK